MRVGVPNINPDQDQLLLSSLAGSTAVAVYGLNPSDSVCLAPSHRRFQKKLPLRFLAHVL